MEHDELSRRAEAIALGETVDTAALSAKTRLGLLVAAALTVLTVIEYFIAVGVENPLLWLLPFAIAKGWLILEYFMHLSAVLGRGRH